MRWEEGRAMIRRRRDIPSHNQNFCAATAPTEDTPLKQFFLASIVAGALALPAYAADYTIMAPAAPGGGWDQTARSLQAALQEEGISGNVQVVNVPGAGGTIGIAQFASQQKGNPNALIVGGYVMVGAILTNQAPVTLADVTPIARLTGEYEAIVVPASSEIQSIDQLVEVLTSGGAQFVLGGIEVAVELGGIERVVKDARVDRLELVGGGWRIRAAERVGFVLRFGNGEAFAHGGEREWNAEGFQAGECFEFAEAFVVWSDEFEVRLGLGARAEKVFDDVFT